MGLYSDVFNASGIYDMLFFNIKSVLIFPSLEELKENEPAMYERWMFLAKTKYGDTGLYPEVSQETFELKGIYYPEFTRIVAITYATVKSKNGELVRNFKKIVSEDEAVVIANFMQVLDYVSSEGVQSTPQHFPTLCGYNVIANDIPLLVKRFIANRERLESKTLPYMLKRAMDIKPWESGVIDVLNVWKFNGFMNGNLMMMAEFMGLKKTTDLLPAFELSKLYWENVKERPERTLELVAHQSATETNLVIQLINELRHL
jgi:hypothetical protein